MSNTHAKLLAFKHAGLIVDQDNILREVFKAGMVARDSGAEFDEANEWFDAYIDDEADRA